ncbi:MAG: sugar transferase [Eubacterium sp.]|nr:sugar transferase [Eubacterium sp.]
MLPWDQLPSELQTAAVRPYYDALVKKEKQLCAKRMLDVGVSVFLLVLLFPVLIGIGIAIATTSEGGVFFRQERVTTYGKKFRIFKFRTMVKDAPKLGTSVTSDKDPRVTKIGEFLRKYRLDELPQLLNIIMGDMSLVGTRPEVEKYVEKYTPEMMATLLLPAGVTSEASIRYKDEAKKLADAMGEEADRIYVDEILPEKMKYNLRYVENYSFLRDLKLCVQTVIEVVK